MPKRTCTAEGCEEKHYAHGWCHRHYQQSRAEWAKRTCSICGGPHYACGFCRLHWQRQRKSGDPRADVPKRDWGRQSCSFPGCDEPHDAGGFCEKHWRRNHKHGDPSHVEKAGWRGDEVGYTAMHERIYRMRGPATDHTCQRCGKSAEDWAYDHSDPSERVELGKGPYSTDPAHYMPLCHSCHMKLDHNGWD